MSSILTAASDVSTSECGAGAPFVFVAVYLDASGNECGSCEGQDVLDAEGNCETCAREIAIDPWAVVDDRTGAVLDRGLSREHANHVRRIREPGPWTDAGSSRCYRPRAVREAVLAPERDPALIITRERDAIHTADPDRPARLGDRDRGINGSPGYTRCGRPAAVEVNALAAAQLYPNLTSCAACV